MYGGGCGWVRVGSCGGEEGCGQLWWRGRLWTVVEREERSSRDVYDCGGKGV